MRTTLSPDFEIAERLTWKDVHDRRFLAVYECFHDTDTEHVEIGSQVRPEQKHVTHGVTEVEELDEDVD